jgi:hypothetical protein
MTRVASLSNNMDQQTPLTNYETSSSSFDNIQLLIELFELINEQARLNRETVRELSKQQFKQQSTAAKHPRNAAIAMLAFTIIGASVSVAGSAIANNNTLGTEVGQSLYRMAPGISAKVFGPIFNLPGFSKIVEATAGGGSKILFSAGEASTAIGNSLNAYAQAESGYLQNAYQEAVDEKRRKSDAAERTLNDIIKHMEAKSAANRAVIGGRG